MDDILGTRPIRTGSLGSMRLRTCFPSSDYSQGHFAATIRSVWPILSPPIFGLMRTAC